MLYIFTQDTLFDYNLSCKGIILIINTYLGNGITSSAKIEDEYSLISSQGLFLLIVIGNEVPKFELRNLHQLRFDAVIHA